MSEAKRHLIHTFIAIGIGLTLFVFFLLIRWKFNVVGFCDACFISGALNLGVTGLLFMGEKGIYDMMGYGMYRVIGVFRDQEKLRYRNAYDFKADKVEKRRKSPMFFLPYLLVSAVLLLAAVILVFFR